MGVSFLAPLFLAGLAALAVPILIHLTHRQRKDAIAFPSLMFVRRIPYRTVRRQRIRHWLLFLMRCAALVLLVAAFSRPLLDRTGEAAMVISRAREVVVLVDRSFSMSYGNSWARAVEAARNAIDGLTVGDRATLVFFSDRAEVAVRATTDRAILRAAIDRVQPSAEATRYGPALQVAQRILTDSDMPRREAILITDFQRVGWESQESLRLPEGTVLTTVDLSDADATNVAVIGVQLERRFRAKRERVSVAARLVNKGRKPVTGLEVKLELNGETAEVKSVTLEPNSSATVQFSSLPLPQRVSRGTVWAGTDPLPRDNTFHFVITPGDAISVLVLEHQAARRNQSLYFRRALEIGVRPSFRVEVKKLDGFKPADLDRRAVVVLNDAPFPGGAAGGALRSFVEGGGGLFVVWGARSSAAAQSAEADGLLPSPTGPPVDRSADRGGTLSFLDYSHPVFELFSNPRSGDFSAARFFRYRPIQLAGPATVLARFDDGAPALVETKPGAGVALTWTSTLDNFWNDLVVQPVFLPFVHQVVSHLAGYVDRQPWYTVGQVLDLADTRKALSGVESLPGAGAEGAEGAVEWVIKTPSGERSLLDLQGVSRFLELREQGFYELRVLKDGDQVTLGTYAVNLDPAESDLSVFDPEELTSAVTRQGTGAESMDGAIALTPEDREKRQGLWWFLLVGAMLMLLTETTISNRLSRRSR